MKTNINKLVKKVLTEQGVKGGASDETAVKMMNQQLKMAYQAGCFPADGNVYNLNGEEVWLKKNSTKVPGFPNAVLRAPVQGQDNGVLEYYSDNELKTKNPTTRTWTCAKLRKLQEDSMNEDLKNFVKTVKDSKIANVFTYGDESVKNTDKVNGVCTLTKLSDFITATKELSSRTDIKSLIPTNTDTFIWVCKQGTSITSSIEVYTSKGYHECTPEELEPGAKQVTKVKVGNIFMCKGQVGAMNLDKNTIYKAINDNKMSITNDGMNKENCRNLIDNYYQAFQSKLPIPQLEIDDAKDFVIACRDNDLIKKDKFLSNKFSKTLEALQYAPTYKFRDGTTISYKLSTGSESGFVRESVLKRIIRENLNELSESKKKSLVEEYNIINTRFKIISESGKPKTKKQKEKFVDDLLSEMFYLKSQGFNDRLINEQFLDIIKGFFGNVPGGIFDTIKERFVQLILEKLGIGTDGYLANIFIATIGDIPVGDYANGKIFNCEYLSNAISKGVGEGIARKIQKEQGMEGYLYDIIRNSLVDMFTDSSFGQKIEGAIADLVCPSISKIKDKMDLAGETMKEKALS